jgi:hypothetical protein
VARDRKGEFQDISGIDDFEPAIGDVDLVHRLLARRLRPVRHRAAAVPGTRAVAGMVSPSASWPPTGRPHSGPSAAVEHRQPGRLALAVPALAVTRLLTLVTAQGHVTTKCDLANGRRGTAAGYQRAAALNLCSQVRSTLQRA